jgi:uracil-DNA glycosylase
VLDGIPADWRRALDAACGTDSFKALCAFVAAERERRDTAIYPAAADVFNALRLTPLATVRAVIVGQDPYHGAGEAHGLSFSVRPGTPIPPSLRNILREWSADLGEPVPAHGSLERWARSGVLLLNTVMTVRRDEPYSHRARGWEAFTDAILEVVSGQPRAVAFLLWGRAAQAKRDLIDPRHIVLASNHPSPLSASGRPVPFRGSRPFSTANAALEAVGQPPIDWRLNDGTG